MHAYRATIGVVSALLLSVTFQSAVNPLSMPPPAADAPPSDYNTKASALEIANAMGVASMLLSLTIIVLVTTFLVEVGRQGRHNNFGSRETEKGTDRERYRPPPKAWLRQHSLCYGKESDSCRPPSCCLLNP